MIVTQFYSIFMKKPFLPRCIANGTKFMSIKVPVCKIRFIDSMNFIPMALADMPKAVGVTELTKDYFPHLVKRKSNYNTDTVACVI
jgi:hypothetical protein